MDHPSITCPRCLMTSYNPHNVAHGWCGNCDAFTSPALAERVAAAAAFNVLGKHLAETDQPGAEVYAWRCSLCERPLRHDPRTGAMVNSVGVAWCQLELARRSSPRIRHQPVPIAERVTPPSWWAPPE